MTPAQARKQIEMTAWNKIRKMFHPLYKFHYDEYDRESSGTEQRYRAIESAIEKMNRELKAYEEKENKKKEDRNRNLLRK